MDRWQKNIARYLIAGLLFFPSATRGGNDVSFNRDIRPILAAHCFSCHGPDEDSRESGLRLDRRDAAIELAAIIPGEPDDSSLVDRIFSGDPDWVMPPPHTKHPLSDDQKQALRDWIASGAKYDQHWAFIPPRAPTQLPLKADRDLISQTDPALTDWPRNGIDWLTLPAMLRADLSPSPESDRYTLVRRLYLDLIGLPPTIEQADSFVHSADPLAYEKLVDELLASPRYGEHWARYWLDLARYADTNGYEKDRPRSIWPYRDWVIRMLNSDMPYDQFTIEQLAGDLLPDPTPDQLIATGFHRNTMLNEEGGIDPLEFRYLSMVDRVATTGTVWMGLTMGCAQCHTHKFDPISHVDYYSFMALLNNADEPDYSIPDSKILQRRNQILAKIRKLEDQLELELPLPDEAGEAGDSIGRAEYLHRQLAAWMDQNRQQCSEWKVVRPTKMKSNLPRLELMEDDSVFASGDFTKRDSYALQFEVDKDLLPIQAVKLEALPDDRLPDRGPGRTFYEGRQGDFFVSEISAEFNQDAIPFAKSSHSFSRNEAGGKANWNPRAVFDNDGSTGWQPRGQRGKRLTLVVNLESPITTPGTLNIELLFERHYVVSLGRFRLSVTANDAAVANPLPAEVERILALRDSLNLAPKERAILQRQFLLTTEQLAEQRQAIDELRSSLPKFQETLILQERPVDHPRSTFRHHRGEYLSPREEVTPAIPAVFLDLLRGQPIPSNRLELARWLVSDANPLAARVAVNRAWRSFFGHGLVRTNGDFGVQTPPPAHPQLLDWLAVRFVAEGWSIKKLHRLIVTSATYRQSSFGNRQSLQQDPGNQWLARAPRFRLPGETIRDCGLVAAGVLCDDMFGPGVYPPQPPGVTELAYGGGKWRISEGKDRYRRSIYTFRKRTAAFAAYSVFDGPTYEACTARRNRSNTPLQALTVLNDKMFVELSEALAQRTINDQGKASDAELLRRVFRSVLTRPPREEELDSIRSFFQVQLKRLESGELKAGELVPEAPDRPRAAALAMVARALLNLDEAVTRH
jgi:hypothetical protein